MILFLFKKMWKNKWLMACLLIGNILLVGVVSATPMYTQATVQRILQQDFRQFQHRMNQHPATISLQFIFNNLIPEHRLVHYAATRDATVPSMGASFGVPITNKIQTYITERWHLLPVEPREENPRVRSVSLLALDDLDANVQLVYGRLPASEMVEGNMLEALASEVTLMDNNLLLNEPMWTTNVESDGSPLYVRIVGIYEPKVGAEWFWTTIRYSPAVTLMVSAPLMRERFVENYTRDYRITANWYIQLDYEAFVVGDLHDYMQALAEWHTTFDNSVAWRFDNNFNETLAGNLERTGNLEITLWVLQVPMYVLLALYIYMVCRKILQLDQNDISVLKSRGGSRLQIMGLYVMQGLFVSTVSLPVGVGLGVVLCRMLGASSGFMYLVQRAALTVEVTPVVLLYASLAMALSFLTMVIPVIGFSRVTIVAHKQRKRGKGAVKSLWMRFYLDILCLGIAIYGWFSFNTRQALLAAAVRDENFIDPLLFVSSSLFIMGAGLFALRLFPYVIQLIYLIGKRFWGPHSYAAMLRVIRSAGEEQFIMIFLVFTLAVGIFSAHSARTINTNSDHRIQYLTGADIVFREFWPNNVPAVGGAGFAGGVPVDVVMPEQVIYFVPDFNRFLHFDEVDAITRVQRHPVRVSNRDGSVVENVELMAIETNTFGETAWFRNDLLRIHIHYFLNTLAENPAGVLLSDNFRTVLGYRIGDAITLRDVRYGFEHNAVLTIVGFVEYWPGYAPRATALLETGETVQVDQHLAVANLGYLQTRWTVMPYQIWMRTNTTNNLFFYTFEREYNLRLLEFNDSNAALTESRSDPILQGINGILTVGFIIALVVCFVGFLIYWVLSIYGRALQFGIFRAIGMSRGELIKLLITEQVLITFAAIAIGALVGEITARLFIPLIQISYTAAQQVIPLLVVSAARDYGMIYTAVGFMILICLIILGIFIMHLKIAQVLKLGED